MKKKIPLTCKYEYKDFIVDCTRDYSCCGEMMTYYQILDKDGVEVVCTFTSDETPFRKFANDLKSVVDDIIENPEMYYEEIL